MGVVVAGVHADLVFVTGLEELTVFFDEVVVADAFAVEAGVGDETYLLALVQAYLLVVLLAIAVWGHARVLLEILAEERGVREVHGLGNLLDAVVCIS